MVLIFPSAVPVAEPANETEPIMNSSIANADPLFNALLTLSTHDPMVAQVFAHAEKGGWGVEIAKSIALNTLLERNKSMRDFLVNAVLGMIPPQPRAVSRAVNPALF